MSEISTIDPYSNNERTQFSFTGASINRSMQSLVSAHNANNNDSSSNLLISHHSNNHHNHNHNNNHYKNNSSAESLLTPTIDSPLTVANIKKLSILKENEKKINTNNRHSTLDGSKDPHIEYGSHYEPSLIDAPDGIKKGGESPIRSAIFNMLAGCGIVGLPITYANGGLLIGVILMIFIAYISVYTLRLLIRAAKKVGVEDYERLCEVCFGYYGYYYLSVSILIFDIGACLTYSIIMGDSAHDVFKHLFGWNENYYRQIIVTLIYIILILPFCLGKNFQFIEKISAGAIFSVIVLVLVITFEYFFNYLDGSLDYNNIFNNPSKNIKFINLNSTQILSALGTISFAFVQHDQTFLVYRTLKNNTMKRYTLLASLALFIQLILCITISLFGYLSFGDNTNDDILQNYSLENKVILITRIGYTFALAFIYPTAFYVVRHISYSIIYKNSHQIYEDANFKQRMIFTFGPWLFFLILSLFLTDLGFVMSLSGLISALNIAFILPCACFLRVTKYPIKFWTAPTNKKWKSFKITFPCVVLLIFGIICGTIGSVQVITAQFS